MVVLEGFSLLGNLEGYLSLRIQRKQPSSLWNAAVTIIHLAHKESVVHLPVGPAK